ncbi:MAG TPA: hypothetical protein VMV17_09960 [Streptosporangiaceae bacterium]|nr:hypothetical protein [Streptosporangiaceae bacterium]
MAQQGPPPPRSGRPPASGQPRRGWSDDHRDDDEEFPPWAGPGVVPRWADHEDRERRRLRDQPARSGAATRQADRGGPPAAPAEPPAPGPRSRRAASRARRARQSKYIWGGALILVLVIVAGIGYQFLHQSHPKPVTDGLVTTFLAGEFKTVPDACSAVTPATLNQYLPGTRRTVRPRSLYGSAQSLCDWSVDARPLYRVLEVTVQAYAPSGLASGNGSATFAAKDAYLQASQGKLHPPKATHLPKATVSQIPGLGSSAFAALQVPSAGGDTTNLLTVVVRDHNVLITVVSEGPARSGRGYARVSATPLQAAAVAAARDIIAHLH